MHDKKQYGGQLHINNPMKFTNLSFKTKQTDTLNEFIVKRATQLTKKVWGKFWYQAIPKINK